jgi:hypothetical protein
MNKILGLGTPLIVNSIDELKNKTGLLLNNHYFLHSYKINNPNLKTNGIGLFDNKKGAKDLTELFNSIDGNSVIIKTIIKGNVLFEFGFSNKHTLNTIFFSKDEYLAIYNILKALLLSINNNTVGINLIFNHNMTNSLETLFQPNSVGIIEVLYNNEKTKNCIVKHSSYGDFMLYKGISIYKDGGDKSASSITIIKARNNELTSEMFDYEKYLIVLKNDMYAAYNIDYQRTTQFYITFKERKNIPLLDFQHIQKSIEITRV